MHPLFQQFRKIGGDMKLIWCITLIFTFGFTVSACTSEQPQTLTVMTHDSFAVSESVIQEFEKANNIKVTFVKSGDAGMLLNQAILTKHSPIADVLYGVDNTFLSRALQEDLFIPYQSPEMAHVDPAFVQDSQSRVLPVDYGDVCINYDIAFFQAHALTLPRTLEDLIKPEYKDMLVVENPATSSPGLVFLLTTIANFGDPGYLNYWNLLKTNGVTIVDGWETAYYTFFSASSGHGEQPMVVSYASSPAVEVLFADPPRLDAPTASLIAKGMCFRQVEYVGILQGTKELKVAQRFIDYMLGQTFQQDIPLQMFMYPVNQNAQLPEVFVKFAQRASEPANMDPQTIADNRERWIQTWTDSILH
jgi:thiamine transport system substrate-binding protein